MSYPINVNIPATGHTPAQDYNGMRANYSNIDSYLSVDHVDPGDSGNGTHKQVTLYTTAAPGAQSNPSSIVYTVNGTANASVVELYYKNATVASPLSSIRGWASFAGASGTTSASSNVTSVTRTGAGVYNVVMSSLVSGTNFVVIVSCSGVNSTPTVPLLGGYSITGSGAFTIYTVSASNNTARDPVSVSFCVLQI